jgi:hypothetical protein
LVSRLIKNQEGGRKEKESKKKQRRARVENETCKDILTLTCPGLFQSISDQPVGEKCQIFSPPIAILDILVGHTATYC